MYQVLMPSAPQRPPWSPSTDHTSTRWAGTGLLERMLDVVDYGMLAVQADGRVLFANKVARTDLDTTHPLVLSGGALMARHACDVLPLREALISALSRGLQRLLSLRDDAGRPFVVAILPLWEAAEANADAGQACAGAMLMLGKRQVCDGFSADAFSRHHKLTTAEARVLKQLCAGLRPAEIARLQGVALCTVRTQIGCMREKTGAASIAALVNDLACLPPMATRLLEAA